MSNKEASTNVQVGATVTSLTTKECISMGHGLEQIGLKSAIYAGSKALQGVVPPVIQDAKDLETADKTVELDYAAYIASVGVRAGIRNTFNKDASAAIAVAKATCKTVQELNQLSFTERTPNTDAPVMPTKVIAKPGKNKGSGLVHCPRFGGFDKYECELSVDPFGPVTWIAQVGTQARRTIGGLVSGQRYWVRFRTRRGAAVSDWSDAVAFLAR